MTYRNLTNTYYVGHSRKIADGPLTMFYIFLQHFQCIDWYNFSTRLCKWVYGSM